MKTMDRRELLRRGPSHHERSVAAGHRENRARSGGLSEQEARELAHRILGMSSAEGTEVRVRSGWEANTRFAVNRVTTAGRSEDVSIQITARFGKRAASVTTNHLDDEGLRAAVGSAEELARLAPENDERMPLLGPQTYDKVRGHFDSTAGLDAAKRGQVAASGIGAAKEKGGLVTAGFLECSARSTALANSAGLFAYHDATSFAYSNTVRTDDGTGSGWAGTGGRDWSEVDYDDLHARAVDKAIQSRDPQPLEPGKYTVVLEPQAVSDLIRLMLFSLSARSADEGRSAFSAKGGGTKLGEQIVDPRVTMISDPSELGSAPFAGGGGGFGGGGFGGGFTSDTTGMPVGRQVWIEDGVLKNLFYSRYWAEKQGADPTPFSMSFIMKGEEASLEDLIAGTERGVLVTRFWYIRNLDPRTILYTGLTRDGNLLIENGRISHPVNNFRWNDSPLSVLNNLEALSRPARISASSKMPALRAREFNFSSVSEAV
jgi:predicted Zn-dependent protease